MKIRNDREQEAGDARRWQAVLERDLRFDGEFVYAVRSTGIYCRPSCASRKPARQNVLFFPLPELAERAGFRPCLRCCPEERGRFDPQVELIREICRYIESHAAEPLTLVQLGRHFHLSASHLQRTFKQVVGISPQNYHESCRMERVRRSLRGGDRVGDALYEAGFGSPSGLYSRAPAQLGMTPEQYRRGGEGEQIHYTVVRCPLGYLLVAATERGICAITIGDHEGSLERGLRGEFGGAALRRDDGFLTDWVESILQHLDGHLPHLHLPLDIRATAFQRRVWQALQEIPYGETRSYSEIAAQIGQPRATRAVARACATNPAALLIPCHRVLRQDGGLGGYRWGIERKRLLLEQEKSLAALPSRSPVQNE